ncbi:ChrR family anti-sigma-E factor [Parasulfitobacter algicola]|uniref:Cupin domain-containing protein n=1 Tax=Parasulfitobacter algicola TaxID=2614809 RepID=A0ABX2J0R3_9RHOB|nr:ChrR family anti-sigma-E factor [Sulfitobacter algicola]NSX56713.1 cupin domain-containing protein [Sulfitobacter algicola]
MSQIKHHLNDSLLMAYSAGTLPEAFNLIVATHISMCDDCRARMHSFDAVGGAMLDNGDTVQMHDDSLDATLKLISTGPKDQIRMAPKVSECSVLPQPLQDYVGGGLDDVRWRSVGMGVKQAILRTSKQATVRLLYIPAGSAMPDHGHNGTELTLVLQGAFQDESDRFGVGDIEIADQDMEHTPVAVGDQACICLAATDARLRFNGLVPRIAQPFLRI